jgi:hypothetical protein
MTTRVACGGVRSGRSASSFATFIAGVSQLFSKPIEERYSPSCRYCLLYSSGERDVAGYKAPSLVDKILNGPYSE